MQVRLINGRWQDANDNSWLSSLSQEEATERASSLVNCSYCRDCIGCHDCHCCHNCSYCRDCIGCHDCSYCRDCIGCHDCSGCIGCSGCSGCSGYQQNPQRILSGTLGSWQAQTAVYWTSASDVQIVCGCFRGDLAAFAARVETAHANNQQYLSEYRTFIQKVRAYMQ